MGLGSAYTLGLKDAREAAKSCRKLLLQGVDPINHRREERLARITADRARLTFKEAMDALIAKKRPGWKSDKNGRCKSAEQWNNTLGTHAAALLPMHCDVIETAHVLKVLEPIWAEITETATKLRERIENVLAYSATVEGRKGDNPARWRGGLEHLLPAPGDIRTVEHHASLPHEHIHDAMKAVRHRKGLAARAGEICILIGARVSEVTDAEWSEFNWKTMTWTIPKERTKTETDREIPLVPALLKVIEPIRDAAVGKYLFPIQHQQRADTKHHRETMSSAAVLKALRESIPGHEVTTHGFRSTYRTWADDVSKHEPGIIKVSMGHARDRVTKAYSRGEMLDKKAALFNDWHRYIAKPAAVPKPATAERWVTP